MVLFRSQESNRTSSRPWSGASDISTPRLLLQKVLYANTPCRVCEVFVTVGSAFQHQSKHQDDTWPANYFNEC